MDNKIPAYIFDIDGTLAITEGTDYSRVSNFRSYEAVKRMNTIIHESGSQIIIVTARPERYANKTLCWLVDNGIRFDAIFFKEEYDMNTNDTYKAKVYHRYIENDYHILAAFDNAPEDIAMWKTLGIPVFQVS